MSEQYPGGWMTKSPPTPSGPLASDTAPGLWTLSQVAGFVKQGIWPTAGNVPPSSDPYFSNVSLLLQGDGSNGEQNNTFLDGSPSARTITRNGNTTQGSFSPYGTLWSNYFDGNGDAITVPDSSAFTLGSNNFTVELWFNADAVASQKGLIGQGNVSSPSTISFFLDIATTTPRFFVLSGSTEYNINSSTAVAAGTWYHIAGVRDGNTLRLFLNGVQVGTRSVTGVTINDASTVLAVGRVGTTSGMDFKGYISNARVVNGTALYTSNFTPPTAPLTAISSTALLTCQSNRFVDNSANAFSVSRDGTPSVQRLNPFAPASPGYTTAVYGASGFFPPGSSQGSTAATPLGFSTFTLSGNFTVEYWLYSTQRQTTQGECVIGSDYGTSINQQIGIAYNTNQLFIYDGSANRTSSGSVNPLGQWTHCAYVRSGSTVTFYINGVASGTATTSASLQIACVGALGGYGGGPLGYLCDVRIVTSALYSGNFTPPTSPVPSVSNTQLLLNFNNAKIIDNAMTNDVETAGSAQISTSVKKYGTGSIYFPGTSSDYITASYGTQQSVFLGKKFTIEFWLYRTSTESNQWIVESGQGYNAANGFLIGYYDFYSSGSIAIAGNGLGAYWFGGNTNVATNTWYHVAVVGDGTNCVVYLNGNNIGSNTWPGGGYEGVLFNGINVGAGFQDRTSFSSPFVPFGGYIDGLRVTEGVARYTSNFTPPNAAFPNY